MDAQPEKVIRSRSATVELTSALTAQHVLPAEFLSFLIYRNKKNAIGKAYSHGFSEHASQ